MLDNASHDGSAGAARNHAVATGGDRARAAARQGRERHRAAAARPRALRAAAQRGLRAAPGRRRWRCATRSRQRDDAAAAGARAAAPRRDARSRSAWRFPTPATALAGALFLHRRLTVQSRGAATREVDWAQSAALLVRADAAREIGWFDPAFFVYSDEVDFCKRLRDAGWRRCTCRRRTRSTTSSSRPARCPSGGSSSSRATATATCASTTRRAPRRSVRVLTAWAYAVRSLAALVAARPRPAALLAPRDRDAAPGPRRGAARGRGRAQPRPAPVGQRLAASVLRSPCPPARRPTTASRSCRCPGRLVCPARAVARVVVERVTGVGDLARAVRARGGAQQRRLDLAAGLRHAGRGQRRPGLRARAAARAHRAVVGVPQVERAALGVDEERAQRARLRGDDRRRACRAGGARRGAGRCCSTTSRTSRSCRRRRARARWRGPARRGGTGGSWSSPGCRW